MTDPAEIHDRLAALYREREKVKARLAEIEREIAATWDELPEGPDAPGLPNTKPTPRLTRMTSAQTRSRNQAISKARAPRAGDKFQQAVNASKWGTANRYARERLKVSPGMLSGYRSGDYTAPDDIQAKVEEDFGLRFPTKK